MNFTINSTSGSLATLAELDWGDVEANELKWPLSVARRLRSPATRYTHESTLFADEVPFRSAHSYVWECERPASSTPLHSTCARNCPDSDSQRDVLISVAGAHTPAGTALPLASGSRHRTQAAARTCSAEFAADGALCLYAALLRVVCLRNGGAVESGITARLHAARYGRRPQLRSPARLQVPA